MKFIQFSEDGKAKVRSSKPSTGHFVPESDLFKRIFKDIDYTELKLDSRTGEVYCPKTGRRFAGPPLPLTGDSV